MKYSCLHFRETPDHIANPKRGYLSLRPGHKHGRFNYLRLGSIVLALLLAMHLGSLSAFAQQEQMADTTETEAGTETENVSEPEETSESGGGDTGFLDKIGFYVSGSGGAYRRDNSYYARTQLIDFEKSALENLYSQYNKPVKYQNKSLRIYDLHLETGFYDMPLVKYNYQTTKFGQQRLDSPLQVQEESSYGLEKFTYGVSLAPVARWFLDEDGGFFNNLALNLLSVQYERTREITQSQADPQQDILYLTSETDIDYGNQTAENFNTIPANQSYAFKVNYTYEEITVPLIMVRDFKYRWVSFEKAYFGVGWSKYSYSRPFYNDYFNLNSAPIVYEGNLQSKSVMLTFSNARNQNEVRNGLFIIGKFGIAYENDFSSDAINWDRMFYPPGSTGNNRREAKINSIHSKVTSWYKIPLTPDDFGTQIAAQLGASVTQFSVVIDESSGQDVELNSNSISNSDFLVELWANLRISI